ncbi:hypothetical protein H4S06_002629, partial [Coemansia sp. BCRC 34490]
MAHLENMRYRKQPGASAIYDDATVISGISPGSTSTSAGHDNNGFYDNAPPMSDASLGY